MNILLQALFKIGSRLLLSLASERVMEKCIFWLLELAASKTETKFDDELVDEIKDQYNNK